MGGDIVQLFQIEVPDHYEIILWGDNQEGNIAQSRDGVKASIDYIMSAPNRYCVHMGDAMEASWFEDKRYQQDTVQNPPLEQKSFELGVSTYSEMAEYTPTELGYIKIIVGDRDVQDVVEVKV